jgi:GT2 family glycosyltransferase
VVDNNSIDGSEVLIKNKFPEVSYLFQNQNHGFGKANNIGLAAAKGKYVFLLNPDTLIEEDTIDKCLSKMEANPDIGALGARLVNGNGEFLPESKRSFPTAWSAFAKLSGLSKILPKSKTFNSYNLGYLDEHEEAEIEVLCGAMMVIRKDVMQDLGGFDEDYFMYGEDIDLCYRIHKAGYKIHYFPETNIVHYKGESSKRHKYAYYKMFYEAMKIYVGKHFTSSSGSLVMNSFLSLAIYLRGGMGFLWESIKKLTHPVVDILALLFGLNLINKIWALYFYQDPDYYATADVWFNLTIYTVVWISSLFVLGNYDEKTGLKNLLMGFGLGMIINLIIYAMLPLEFRFSRAVLILGGVLAFIIFIGTKYIFNYFTTKTFSLQKPIRKDLFIIGEKEECKEIESLLVNSKVNYKLKAYLNPYSENNDPFFSNSSDKLEKLISLYPVNEIIFSAKSVSYKDILSWMTRIDDKISVKIAGRSMFNIIGSDSANETGELYTVDVQYRIKEQVYKRLKRVLDIVLSLIALILSPIRFVLTMFKASAFIDPFKVLFNLNTWVAYGENTTASTQLPALKPGIFNVSKLMGKEVMSQKEIENINIFYARNYNILQDIEVFVRSIFKS